MKAIVLASLLVLSVACGQVSGRPTAAVASPSASPVPTPVASPTSEPSASPNAQPSPSSEPSPMATPKTSLTLLFAVLEAKGTANAWTYNTVAIAGLDGYARAKTTFSPMPVPVLGCMGAVLPPSAHVAAGKIFFADSKGVIRSLAIDGTVAVAATFPMTSTQQMLSFAVSPDGTKLLGTVFTVPSNAGLACSGQPTTVTYTFDAYSAPAGGASTLVYHHTWSGSQDVLALTGWDAVGPIGTYPTVWASQGGGPGSTLGVKVRIDAATIRPGTVLSDPTKCQVWDSITSGSFVCMGDAVMTGGGTADQRVNQPVSIRNTDGTEAWQFTATGLNAPFGPLLSPDGTHVMVCCNDLILSDSHELLVGKDGKQVNLAQSFGASGWLDATTMVGWVNSNMAYVAANAPGVAVSMGFAGEYLGTIRS